jgi:hypothetical protein
MTRTSSTIWNKYTARRKEYNNFYPSLKWYGELGKGIRVITKLPNSEQSTKGKVKTHKYINKQNQSTTGKL